MILGLSIRNLPGYCPASKHWKNVFTVKTLNISFTCLSQSCWWKGLRVGNSIERISSNLFWQDIQQVIIRLKDIMHVYDYDIPFMKYVHLIIKDVTSSRTQYSIITWYWEGVCIKPPKLNFLQEMPDKLYYLVMY